MIRPKRTVPACWFAVLVAGGAGLFSAGCFSAGYNARLQQAVSQNMQAGPFKVYLHEQPTEQQGITVRLLRRFDAQSNVVGPELGPKGDGRAFRYVRVFPERKNHWLGVVVGIYPPKGEKPETFITNFHRQLKERWDYEGAEAPQDIQLATPSGSQLAAKLYSGKAKVPLKPDEPEGQLVEGRVDAYLVTFNDKVVALEWVGIDKLTDDEKFFEGARISTGTLAYNATAAAEAAKADAEKAKAKK